MDWSRWRTKVQELFKGSHQRKQADSGLSAGPAWRPSRNYDLWHECQFAGLTDHARQRELVIGLDFGTSFTKVVVGEARTHRAVPFYRGDRGAAYLLPTAIAVEREGEQEVVKFPAPESGEGGLIDRLKIRLLDGEKSEEVLAHNAAYLALVLRHVRGWLMERHVATYGDERLDWLVNVGLPTDTFFDSEIGNVYCGLVRAAWSLSVQEGAITLAKAFASVSMIEGGKDQHDASVVEGSQLHADKIAPFPELVAEVTGYLRSPMRQDDLHVLVDVGAGTLDVAVFNVHQTRDEEDILPIFEKSVTGQGTAYLMEWRRTEIADLRLYRWRYQEAVPSAEELARETRTSQAYVDEVDQRFGATVKKSILTPVQATRMSRHPRSPCWTEGVPLIACGGGVACEPYASVIHDLLNIGKPFPFYRLVYPVPRDLEAKSAAPDVINRLNVAYGLSFSPLDLAHVRGPREIEDQKREVPVSRGDGKFVDKDMV